MNLRDFRNLESAGFKGCPIALEHQRCHGFTLVEIMIVVALIAMLATLALPSLMRSRKRSQATLLLEDLRLIDGAKTLYGTENNQPDSVTPKVDDLRPYLKVGTRLYDTTQLSNFRDDFARPILMGDLQSYPTIDDLTRDYFSDVVVSKQSFWGAFAN